MIVEKIKQIRKTLCLSQGEFGVKLGVSRDVISNIENGRVEPKDVFLKHMCNIFNVDINWLLKDEGTMFENDYKEQMELEVVTSLFTNLNKEYREYAISQLKGLLDLQKTKISTN